MELGARLGNRYRPHAPLLQSMDAIEYLHTANCECSQTTEQNITKKDDKIADTPNAIIEQSGDLDALISVEGSEGLTLEAYKSRRHVLRANYSELIL